MLPQFRGHDGGDVMVVVEVNVESIASQSPFLRAHRRGQSSIRMLEHGMLSKNPPLPSGGGRGLVAAGAAGPSDPSIADASGSSWRPNVD